MPNRVPVVDREAVVRLWLERQGLAEPFQARLDKPSFVGHLERTGGLQLDSINVVDRAHYLTLWSRFGEYDRRKVDRWVYRDRAAYEYWGHEASILPSSHLPVSCRRMRRFPPASWTRKAWWPHYTTSTASKRRVLRRIRREGPLESADFEAVRDEFGPGGPPGQGMATVPKEDKRSLKLLWHDGRLAICDRRSFRCVYDVAERVYPQTEVAALSALEDSWLFAGLSGNGIASERHLVNYWTAASLKAPDRQRVLSRNLRKKRIVKVSVDGLKGPHYALPEHLERLARVPEPRGTTLVCPFDSLLWQRARANELLGFAYKVEIYIPAQKREFGYYVLPILHNGRLVGRVDPKLHRDRGALEIRSVHVEPGFQVDREFCRGTREALESLASFLDATEIEVPSEWRRKLT